MKVLRLKLHLLVKKAQMKERVHWFAQKGIQASSDNSKYKTRDTPKNVPCHITNITF